MMFPSLRGGNDNPGTKEGFLGEVNDVLASADYLAREPSVDPNRMYLGGHSTGGTLVLLVAESTDRFRAVFSFGPVSDVSGYLTQYLPFDTSNSREVGLRSPGRWLESIHCARRSCSRGQRSSNISSLKAMQRRPRTRWFTSWRSTRRSFQRARADQRSPREKDRGGSGATNEHQLHCAGIKREQSQVTRDQAGEPRRPPVAASVSARYDRGRSAEQPGRKVIHVSQGAERVAVVPHAGSSRVAAACPGRL